MNSLNSILVEGNLTRDPVLKETPKGTPVCTFGIASNRYYRSEGEQQKETSFFNIEVWSGLAKNCAEYLTKGRGVRVVGRMKQDLWTDEEGNRHERWKVVGEHVEFKPDFRKQQQPELEDGIEGETDGDLQPVGADSEGKEVVEVA